MSNEDHVDTSDVTVRAIRTCSGESPATVTEEIEQLFRELSEYWPELVWQCSGAGAWEGSVAEKQRQISSQVAVDVDGEAVPERGAALSLTAQVDALHFHLIVTAGAPVVGQRVPLQQVSMRLVSSRGESMSVGAINAVLSAMVKAWNPVLAVATTRDLALASPVSGWDVPIGLMLWVARRNVSTVANSQIVVSPAGVGTLLTADQSRSAGSIAAEMRRVLDEAGLAVIPR